MGMTDVRVTIANARRPKQTARLKFLADSGAAYSLAPARILRRLGIKPGKTRSFILPTGPKLSAQ